MPDVSLDIAASLSGPPFNLPSDDVASAIDSFNNLDARVGGSVLGILDGKVDAASLSPIIAAGAAAMPGIGPAAVAAISIAAPVLSAIASLFSSPAPSCAWRKNYACFQGPTRPWGPTDQLWQKFDDLKRTDYQLVNQAFPWYWALECELEHIGPNTQDAIEQFRLAYGHAWKANAEFWLNGYQGVDDKALLSIVAKAWNSAHGQERQHTFAPQQPQGIGYMPFADMGGRPYEGCPKPPLGGTAPFIETVLFGSTADVGQTGTRGAPVSINTGHKILTTKPVVTKIVFSPKAARFAPKPPPPVTHFQAVPIVKKSPVMLVTGGIAGAAIGGPIGAVVGLGVGWILDKVRP